MRRLTLLKGIAFNVAQATSSVEIAYPFGFERLGVGISGLLGSPLLRCVRASFEHELIAHDESLRSWLADRVVAASQIIHTTPTVASTTFLMVDRQWGVVVWWPSDGSSRWTASIMDASIGRNELMEACTALFDELISNAASVLLHDTRLESTDSEEQQTLAVASRDYWNGVIDFFAKHPEQLQNVHPRRFEELIAELLVREGLRVELTPAIKDGGVDVLAFADTPIGHHLYLIECKRYAHSHPVGVELVRSLYGVVEAQRATAGMLVTTSSFTRGALQLQRTLEHRISLKPLDELTNWLRRSS